MMSKLLIPLSVSLIASLSLTTPVKAELPTDNLTVNANWLCSQSVNQLSLSNHSLPQNILLAEVILDHRPSYNSQCGDWYTTIKYGKVYECIKCSYGGPYCWEKP